MNNKEHMSLVFVGHVDHGKSTVLGRLLADTKSLPEGKLDFVKAKCKRESKVFEYAFLLDALKDEQNQGITIDSARCFFKTRKREYLIIDAPGHIEFLKNMISGAARAEAAVLIIDAQDGVQENSKRHGYMLSMLGIKQVIVCVNKMDLVNYRSDIFEKIKTEYSAFLKRINIQPLEFIPISGLKGDNIAKSSDNLAWFGKRTLLEAIDDVPKEELSVKKPFRMPVQDIYKFTNDGDNRRIIAGRIESGTITCGDKVVFLPSNKVSSIKSIERFNALENDSVSVGYSTGFTFNEQIYVGRGEIMCKVGEKLPSISSQLNVSIFWMSKDPLVLDKEYKLKICTREVSVKVKAINNVLNASDLSREKKEKVDRYEVADCVLECSSPIAFDLFSELQNTARFVLVDNYDISGGGIITGFTNDEQKCIRDTVFLRESKWYRSLIPRKDRAIKYSQVPKLVLITGKTGIDKQIIAQTVEQKLFEQGKKVYFLGIGNLLRGLDSDIDKDQRKEHIRRLSEVAHILIDAGLIVLLSASDLVQEELMLLKTIAFENDLLVVTVGTTNIKNKLIDLKLNSEEDHKYNANKIIELLMSKGIIFNPDIY